ncbi:MAG: hypothetical protein MRJ92_05810 [Nitrospira sp.]|nr:hypothetical protein [Nitrospira sp.]
MQITLDDQQWQVPDDSSLLTVAFVSRQGARATPHVTSLTVSGKTISDQDLDHTLLNRRAHAGRGRSGGRVSIAPYHHRRR